MRRGKRKRTTGSSQRLVPLLTATAIPRVDMDMGATSPGTGIMDPTTILVQVESTGNTGTEVVTTGVGTGTMKEMVTVPPIIGIMIMRGVVVTAKGTMTGDIIR